MRRMGRGGSWFELKRARARNAQPQRTRARCGCDVTFHLVLLIAVVCDCPLLHHPPPTMCVPSSSLCRDDAVIIQGTSMAISSPHGLSSFGFKKRPTAQPPRVKKSSQTTPKISNKTLLGAARDPQAPHAHAAAACRVYPTLLPHTCHRELPLLAAGKLRQAAAECGGAGAGVGWCCVGFKTLH